MDPVVCYYPTYAVNDVDISAPNDTNKKYKKLNGLNANEKFQLEIHYSF